MSASPGDADRERLAAALGRHFAEGRLDADALDERLDIVYGADAHAQAAGALAGLPPLGEPVRRRWWWGRRHGETKGPETGWVPSTERFRDPTTRRIMRVWVDPVNGERHYIAERSG